MGDTLRRGLFQQRRVINMHVRLRNLGEFFAEVKEWDGLLEVLRDLGNEFGFHEVTLELHGRELPPHVPSRIILRCAAEPNDPCVRYWHLDIPLGRSLSDDSHIMFSRPVMAGSTNYMVSTLVESMHEALPSALDRLLPSPAVRQA